MHNHWAAALRDLKTRLESRLENDFEIYIEAIPESLWNAIGDSETRGNTPVRRYPPLNSRST